LKKCKIVQRTILYLTYVLIAQFVVLELVTLWTNAIFKTCNIFIIPNTVYGKHFNYFIPQLWDNI